MERNISSKLYVHHFISRKSCETLSILWIQRNVFFAHSENLLIAVISDERQHIRELGMRRILETRMTKHNSIREFVIPELNFDANEYYDMIHWSKAQVTEPPLTANVSN